jgi:4-diphosphocytidyl-2-C-methyl-D-erythritol kinase
MSVISWHDTVWVSSEGQGLSIHVSGRAEGIPTEIEKNLAGRAALKLAAAARLEPRAIISLHKVLPPGGGLGGGSSDAASVLLLLNEAWGLRWPEERLFQIAAELGSDVPFFVAGRPSLCTGRGEIMADLQANKPLFAVLIVPPIGCPTKEVYQAFDAGHRYPDAPLGTASNTRWRDLARSSPEALDEMLINDLQPAAFHVAPRLGELHERAQKAAGRRIHMTGSGSTLFAICSSGADASELQMKLQAHPGVGMHGDASVCVAVRLFINKSTSVPENS